MPVTFRIQSKPVSKPTSPRLPPTKTFRSVLTSTYSPELIQLPWNKDDKIGKTQASGRSRVREGLWWAVITPMAVSPKRVVRSWTRRRITHAFKEALGVEGFTSTGMIRESTRGASQNDMQGTLKLLVNQLASEAPISLIREETLAIVKELSKRIFRKHQDEVASTSDIFRRVEGRDTRGSANSNGT